MELLVGLRRVVASLVAGQAKRAAITQATRSRARQGLEARQNGNSQALHGHPNGLNMAMGGEGGELESLLERLHNIVAQGDTNHLHLSSRQSSHMCQAAQANLGAIPAEFGLGSRRLTVTRVLRT